ncbi:MAG TPA: protein-disulfide isomerase [Cellvibrionales bacterium]|nr:protein-disulfide isomerase [Cellvibrionales bacterium]
MRKLLIVLCLMVSQLSLSGAAAAKSADEQLLEKLKKARPDFQFGEVSRTPVKGIYKSNIVNGPTIYITADGNYFFAGDFFEVGSKGLVNLGEQEMEQERAVALSKMSLNDMVVFSPEKTKAYVYVFTDVDCYYCQKLHQEMPALHELGVEVRYLAYPRAGIGSPSYRKIASAWCADSPTESLTALKNGENIPDNVCEPNPVAEHFRVGGQLGVAGTPALVTADGKLLPGYMPADKLAEALGL